ncbi:MAG: UDP-N-acetylglucosamine 2-epimerase [Bacillota bacterium]|nr:MULTISPECIES: UDP-N-acetylglucosamine 2-epimerase [Bacillaceae]MCC2250749.1 UDP-N-acetylglucosamine 2-epimerase [Virgibacillus sp. AGTR]MDY7042829.1 UDP-N-acetylglucosamine 2-epimerase [Virgibacillus sp. M23]WBX78604.1 UDP-N-acetylglucosamine 2-epimerase [Virgibacillus salarius]
MEMSKKKKILFITGTRADYGKIKSLMNEVEKSDSFELYVFVTGMHMLEKYGSTWKEIEKDGFKNMYLYINQNDRSHMDITLSNTISGISNYVQENKPDLIIIHGDRLEALAGAIVGAFNNIRVAHIEGGEVSGTIDESIRHAITKFSHIHLVSNEEARRRILQLGEKEETIHIIGSPDIDIMLSDDLPSLAMVKDRYDINFGAYAIVMYHPVTTELDKLSCHVNNLVDSLIESNQNFIVIYPNNDEGNHIIIKEYNRFKEIDNIKVYPSMRFEYFLTLLKHAQFIIGNSSAGIREASIYGIPSINIGNRQQGRYDPTKFQDIIISIEEEKQQIGNAISSIKHPTSRNLNFGDGTSHKKFINLLEDESIWNIPIQKKFIDTNLVGVTNV